MKAWPSEEDYRKALRVLTEGVPGEPGKSRWTDPALVGWAHVIMSQAISEVRLHRHKRNKDEGK